MSLRNSFAMSPPINDSVSSNWIENIKPVINADDGQYTNNADSHVIMTNFQYHSSILIIILIVIAILLKIHCLIQFFKAHSCCARRSERNKSVADVPHPGAVPTCI